MSKISQSEVFSIAEMKTLLKSGMAAIQQDDQIITRSLFWWAQEGHRDILDLCDSLINVKCGPLLNCIETSFWLIEEVIDADFHLEQAMEKLNASFAQGNVISPYWHLLARSNFRFTQEFYSATLVCFSKDAAYFAEVMERSNETRFIPLLTDHLTTIAPFIKYLPLTPDSNELIKQHDDWLRVGKCYIKLLNEKIKADLIISDKYLNARFINVLPSHEIQWFINASNEMRKSFMDSKAIYLKQMN